MNNSTILVTYGIIFVALFSVAGIEYFYKDGFKAGQADVIKRIEKHRYITTDNYFVVYSASQRIPIDKINNEGRKI
jgi:hypothetical protein